jgi:predicted cupin superfamily sugar epimerase
MPDDEAPIGRRTFLQGVSLAGAAALSTGLAKAQEPVASPDEPVVISPDTPASSLVNPGKPMPEDVTAAQIRDLLKLEPNQTCGFVRDTYRSALTIAPGGLPAPFETGRPLGTALFFMVTPEAPVKLHRIKNDQLYHYYQGDPIEVLMLYESGTSELVVVGPQHCRRSARAAVHSRRHVPHRAHHGNAPLVPRRLDRVAWCRRRERRRARQCGRACHKIS